MISQSSTTLNDEERRAGWPLHLRLFAHQLFRIVRSAISAITGTRISAGESETEQHRLTEEEVAHSRLLRSLTDSLGRPGRSYRRHLSRRTPERIHPSHEKGNGMNAALLDFEELTRDSALEIHPRTISEQDLRRFEGYMAEIFTAMGMDTDTPGTEKTPQRFVRALLDTTAGYDGDPKLLTVFDTECREDPGCRRSQVVEGPIRFYALCEHHALPFYGHAHIAYIAQERIIGVSKLTRLVRLFARRFTVQERMGQQIADALESMLQPHGVAVYLEGHHLCTQMRGVQESSSLTRTAVWRGDYQTDAALRAEFLVTCGAK